MEIKQTDLSNWARNVVCLLSSSCTRLKYTPHCTATADVLDPLSNSRGLRTSLSVDRVLIGPAGTPTGPRYPDDMPGTKYALLSSSCTRLHGTPHCTATTDVFNHCVLHLIDPLSNSRGLRTCKRLSPVDRVLIGPAGTKVNPQLVRGTLTLCQVLGARRVAEAATVP
jgi:hypothetical protein